MSEVKVRASSWASLFDCAHKWEGTNLLGLTMPTSPRAMLGTGIHASTAIFDQGRLDGDSVTIDDAAGTLIDTLSERKSEVDWSVDDLSLGQCEQIGLTLHSKYCSEVSPNYNFISVELETKPLTIDCGHDVFITLTGTLDRARVRETAKGPCISDLKTGAMAVQKGAAKTKGHRAQVGTYELLYEHTTGNLIKDDAEIIGLKTKGKLEIATAPVPRAKELMAGDGNQPGLIEYAREFFRTGLFPPNPSSMLCSEKYCARWKTCPYHD